VKDNQIIGPGKDNYGQGWGYKGDNKCPKCDRPTHPNEIKIHDGMCNICYLVSVIKKKNNTSKQR